MPFFLLLLFALAFIAAACQPSATNTNTNTNTANVNASPAANTNASPATTDAGSAIDTREPDRYRATITLTAEMSGESGNKTVPTLSAEVARDRDVRRVGFKLPNGEQIVYLDRPEKRYLLLPNRKQYAELTSESLGFDIARLMTPGQIVDQLKRQRGYERVGEETVEGRTAVKYRYTATAKTQTQAGQVNTETFVYVDKETGLPLRADLTSEAQNEVKGVRSAHIVAVMKDISTEVDASQFDVPQGYSKVDTQQLRQQVEAAAQLAKIFLTNMLAQSSASPGASPGASTAASPAASPATSPARP
ncbi:MAG TPA: hypothetical protein VGB17_05260 [Pyrinomonadaceae bacterium]|jgi:hypothetical protein